MSIPIRPGWNKRVTNRFPKPEDGPSDPLKGTGSACVRSSLLSGIAVVLMALSVLPQFARWHWMCDLVANLRVQLICGLLAYCGLCTMRRLWRTVALVGAIIVWQASALLPAFRSPAAAPPQTGSSPSKVTLDSQPPSGISVLTMNVYTWNRRNDQIVRQIQSARSDIFTVLELNSQLQTRLEQEFGQTHKHSVGESQDDGNFGIGLWSRYPFVHADVIRLSEDWLPSIEAEIQLPNHRIRIISTHPVPPMGQRGFELRNRQLNVLADRVAAFRSYHPRDSVIVVGDLNLTPWSPVFDDFLTRSGLKNAASGHGLEPTWYRWKFFPFGLLIDNGLYAGSLQPEDRAILPDMGSDHRGVLFRWRLLPQTSSP